MIKKGIIATLFALGGVTLSAAVVLPICYAFNEQYQNVDSSQSDNRVLVKNETVYLSDEDNPLYPGDSRELYVSASLTIAGQSNVSVYFDSFEGEGYDYLSLSIKDKEEECANVVSIGNASKESPIAFEAWIEKDTELSFRYTLSRDLPSSYESLSFSFSMHMRVERK